MNNMNIDRHNYESFFLLYVDRELDAAGRTAVEDFVAQNPDLEKELALLQQSVFPSEEPVVFAGKQALLKGDHSCIHAGNYESFFILYADDELGQEEKRAVESFVYHHPQYQEELELLQAVRMEPDTAEVFGNKQSLYRYEERDDKVVPFRLWPLAAAAIMLLLFGLWWMMREKPAGPMPIAHGPQKSAPLNQTGSKAPAGIGDTGQGVPPAPISAPEAPIAQIGKKKEEASPVSPDDSKQPGLAIKTTHNNQTPVTTISQDIAQQPTQDNDRMSNSTILPDRQQNALTIKSVTVKPALIAQAVALNRPVNTNTDANVDFDDPSNNDRIAIMNTSVKKTALRGFLRKASRVIAKNTRSGDDDDDNQKHILIGGFAIPVK